MTSSNPQSLSDLGRAALAYAERYGWYVFPLQPRNKRPIFEAWQEKATTDPETIRHWWSEMPQANIAIACGPSGLVVADLDPDKGGLEAWTDLKQQHRFNDDTVTSQTGGGGEHRLYTAPEEANIRNSAGKLGPGIDIRANGGYIVAPPSVHPNGTPYAWEASSHPEDIEPIPLPPALLELLSEDAGQATAGGIPITFSEGPTTKPDLATWRLSGRIVQLIYEPPPKGERSESDQAVITALIGQGASDDDIRAVFQHYPVGQAGKYAEKGRHADTYLATSIANARAFVKTGATQPHSAASYEKGRPLERGSSLIPRLQKTDIQEIKILASHEPPDPGLRQECIDALLGTNYQGRRPSLLKRAEAGQLLLTWLQANGGFVQSTTEEPFYFYEPGRHLFPLDTTGWLAWLYSLTGANPASLNFRYLLADCNAEVTFAPRRDIVRLAAYDTDNQVLRVSGFDGKVYVLDGRSIQVEANGANVLFQDDPAWVSYQPNVDEPGSMDWLTSELPTWDGDRDVLALAFRAWIISMFFTELCPSKPLVVFTGEKGSGKTTCLRLLLQFLFGPTAQVGTVPDKPDAFTAIVAASHLIVLDNLDKFTPWLREKLPTISTGGDLYYRRLYTSNQLGCVKARCWASFTSRQPDTLRRDDLADRLLLLPVRHVEDDDRLSELDLFAQVAYRRDAWWGEVLRTANQVVASLRQEQPVTRPSLRLADWEVLGRVIARNEDKERTWDKFCNKLQEAQHTFLLEDNPIVDALDIWLEDPTNHERTVLARVLYAELTICLYGEKRPTSEWPKSALSFARRFRTLRTALPSRIRISWETGTTRETDNRDVYQIAPK